MSFQPDDSILNALAFMDEDAEASVIPGDYCRAVRTGTPGSRHRITINKTTAHITIQAQSPNPLRDVESFEELIAAMTAAVTDGIQPELPREISMVVWHHEGREVRVCAPGTASDIRRARIRRRLSALSPLPMLGWLTQPLAGSATAVGIAVAPVLPPMHQHNIPAAPIVREMTGDIARPELPYAPGSVTPAPEGLPWTFRPATPAPPPLEATARDTTPTAPTPPLIHPTPTGTVPPAARTATTPSPTPTPTLTEDATSAPSAPVFPPFGQPKTEASSDPTVTSEPSPTPTVSVTELLEPVLHPTRGPEKHHKRHGRHHLRGIGRHR
jgi:hypothetical protein